MENYNFPDKVGLCFQYSEQIHILNMVELNYKFNAFSLIMIGLIKNSYLLVCLLNVVLMNLSIS
jgi:hypothetical protein